MPLSLSSPKTLRKPSLKLALVSALIVGAHDRRWLASAVNAQTAAAGGPSAERLSRLRAKLQPRFEALLEEATRRGRPPAAAKPTDESAVLRELLALIPRDVWADLPSHEKLRLVQAQMRLKKEHGMSADRFCAFLRIPSRTFRSWKRRLFRTPAAAANSGPSDEPQPPSAGEPRHSHNDRATGRFDLERTVPGLQVVADTTEWDFFDLPLRLVATQDPGRRKERIWESYKVDVAENSELVTETILEAAEDRPGTQVVTDQGSPYMAAATEQALDGHDCEHAPQREGRPTDKATKERAFRTVKDALQPLVDFSRRMARRFPILKRPGLAKRVGSLVLSTYLRVYEAAPRQGGHPLEGREATELRAIAQEQRERARMEHRSKRLLLKAIHREFHFPRSAEAFVRAHRDHALEDIQEADRILQTKACRCKQRACDQYFGGILRTLAERNRNRRSEQRRLVLRAAEQRRTLKEGTDLWKRRVALALRDPHALLAEGLDMIAMHWRPESRSLFAEGQGLGVGLLRLALSGLHRRDALAVGDGAETDFIIWSVRRTADPIGLQEAVHAVLLRELAPFRRQGPSTPEILHDRILQNRHVTNRNRPHIARPSLRNYAAGAWG